MNHSFLRKFMYFTLVLLMVTAMVPAFMFSASAAESTASIDFSTQGYSNQQKITTVTIDDNITATFDKGSNSNAPKYYTTGTAVRLYGGGTLTIKSEKNCVIKKINLSFGSSDGSNAFTANVGTWSSPEWTGSANEVVLTEGGTSGNRRIKAISVTYEASTGGHSHDYVWDNVVGINGSHTLECSNTDGSCTVSTKTEPCEWNESTVTTDPTCTSTGEKTFTCTVCSAKKTEVVEMTDHNYVDGSCSVCGETVPLKYTFDYTTGSNGTLASNVKEGLVTLTFSKGTGSNAPTWYSSGGAIRFYANNTLTISTVEGYYIKSIALTYTNSTYFNNVNVGSISSGQWTPADEDAASVMFTYVASKDNSRVSKIEVELGAICYHTNKVAIGEAKDATCTEDGITAGEKCADCGYVIAEQETIPATGHKDENPADSKCDTCGTNLCTEHVWVDGDVITPATCNETGLQAQVCENCGEPGEDKVIDALEHNIVTDAAVAATCTTTGLTEGSHCDREGCGYVEKAQEVTNALGHTWSDNTCSVCGTTRTVYNKVDPATLVEGDRIVIYYSAGGLLISSVPSGNKLSGVGAVVDTENNIVYTVNTTDELLLTVKKDGNGDFYFETADGKYLTSGETGNSLTLESTLTDYAKWYFDTTGTNATLRIVNCNATYNGKAQALEYYNNFTVYGIDDTAAFGMEIYIKFCAHTNTEEVGKTIGATCTEDGITAGEKCADCGKIIKEQEVIEATGHNFVDGVCTNEGCDEIKCDHIDKGITDGEITKVPTCKETGLQEQFCVQCGQPLDDKVLDKLEHTPVTDEAVAPTCIATGLTEGSHCSVCDEVLTAQTTVDMIDHNYEGNTCTMCGDVRITGDNLAEFQFGENGTEGHKDGGTIKAEDSYTNNDYTLKFDSFTNVYKGAFDAKGNSALKLGTSSKAGSFTFTVPANVNTVVLYIAGYKTETAKVDVNETEYEITSKSNEGAYTKIVVDTTSNKTVALTTLSGGYRAMINSIEFWGDPVPVLKSVGLTLNEGVKVNVKYDIPESWLTSNPGAKIQFSIGGVDIGDPIAAVAEVNTYSVQLTPGQIASELKVKVVAENYEGKAIDVSVKVYYEKVEAISTSDTSTDYTYLLALLDSILELGNVTKDPNITINTTFEVEDTEIVDNSEDDKKVFCGASAVVGEKASVKQKINMANINNGDGYTLEVTVSGETVAKGNILNYLDATNEEGIMSIVITGICPSQYNDKIEIIISNGPNESDVVAKITFTFNAYLKKLYDDKNTVQATKNIAAAAYNYGVYAEEFLKNFKPVN